VLAALTAGALAVGGLTALESQSAPPAAALGSLGDLAVGINPSGVAVSPDGTLAMVANAGDGTVSVLDVDGPVTLVDTVTVGGEPVGVTFTPDGAEAWVSTWSGNAVKVIDVATLSVVDTISAGNGSFSVTFSNDGATAYVINYNGQSVAVVDTATRVVDRTITGFSYPQTAVLSADGLTLDVLATSSDIVRLDLTDDSIENFPLDSFPQNARLTPDGSELWVTLNGSDSIAVLDPVDLSTIAIVPSSDSPMDVEVAPNGRAMLVSHDDGVDIVDLETRSILGTIPAIDSASRHIALIPGTGRAVVAQYYDNAVRVLGFEQERLSGADRFSTAVEISQRAFPTGATTVFVASGRTFPDALAAGPAAGTLGGALLLTEPGSLPTVVRDEIVRLNPDTIYLVGGTGAVSTAVENALKVLQPNTIRLSGANRYATGSAIVDEVWGGTTVPEVFIATGRNYPDALSAGAVAAGEGIPVILVDGTLGTVPQATIDLITELGPTQITIAGGTGAVSAGIASQLDAAFTAEVRRLSGANRYATSAAINLDAYPTNAGVIYATGTGFADALAGAALAGRAQIPVYLVQPGCVPAAALDAIWSGETTNLFLLGGTGALSTAVENLTSCP
jgi:YVTN family beta-propeller protein